MKAEKAKSKKKFIYYVTLAISAVLLIVATVLTVYFVAGGNNEVVERPPVVTPPDDTQVTPPDDNKPNNPTQPTGGEGTKFVAPLANVTVMEDYNVIYASATTGFIYRHKAVDFGAEEGTEVYSMADGVVLEVSLNDKTGNYIKVDHGDGLITLYRFVEPVAGLNAGTAVKKGETIAKVAAAYGSEAKDGTHLHLEVFLNGAPADPANYIEIVHDEK